MFRSILVGVLGSLLAGGLVVLAPAEAQLRPLQEVLFVEAGATCLERKVLAETIESWLGRSGLERSVTAIEVRGDPKRANAVAITVTFRGEEIERSFDPAPTGCSELHAVVGLAVAIAVDTSVLADLGYDVVEPDEPAPRPAEDAERAPLLRRSREREEEGGGERRARARIKTAVAVGIRGGVWLGVLPSVAGGGGGQLELGWLGAVDLRLGMWAGHGVARVFDTSRFALTLAGGRVDVCAALPRKHLRPRLCFGPAAGALVVGAQTLEVNEATSPWMALVLAPELRLWATRGFALDVMVDLVVPVIRPVLVERDPSKEDMIGRSLALPPVGAVVGFGAAFAIR